MKRYYNIPLQKPHLSGREGEYMAQAILHGHIGGDGPYTRKCHVWLQDTFNVRKAFLTTSCTTALEIAALLINVQEPDEIVVPSFTFVSTVNPFVARGARPVFVDIRPDTFNIDETLVPGACTPRTRAIVPVHYAGVACEMEPLMDVARRRGLYVIEDAACAFGAKYADRYLGTIGDIGCFSFHETKNVTCGEGGAIVLNKEELVERAEIIREKGTNRSQFLRGEVEKYTWMDVGLSGLPSDLLAAFLFAQFEVVEECTQKQKGSYTTYRECLGPLEKEGVLRLPYVPGYCETQYDTFHILLHEDSQRDALMRALNDQGIGASFHYLPLHLSPMGQRFGYTKGDLPVTERISACILRLPLYYDLTPDEQVRIIDCIVRFFNRSRWS